MGGVGRGRRDIAIYAPMAASFFGGRGPRADSPAVPRGGGAELQMTLLATGLAELGRRVALIVYPGCTKAPPSGMDLVERGFWAGYGPRGKLGETREMWRAMKEADADVYVFRGTGAHLAVAAAFCLLHRRKFVFSAALDLDFDFDRPDRGRFQRAVGKPGLRRADLVVTQRRQQEELARRAGLDPVVTIPSFAEPAEPSGREPEVFLWIGRLVPYKRPLPFVQLAEAVPEARFRMICTETIDTPPALAEEVREAGERLDNLEVPGQLPRAQVLEDMDRAVAVVSTSAAEGMPNVFLEAWARGVPVVSLEYDPDDQIQTRGLGVIADGSQERLTDAVRSLWSDGSRRAELGRAGREYVREVHSPDAVTARWDEELEKLR